MVYTLNKILMTINLVGKTAGLKNLSDQFSFHNDLCWKIVCNKQKFLVNYSAMIRLEVFWQLLCCHDILS